MGFSESRFSSPAASATPSACATFDAMSDWTWKTSVSDASKGCCHFEAGGPSALDLDELRADLHAAAAAALLPAHRGGQQIAGRQLPGDLLRRLGRLLVWRRAAARDHLDPGKRGQLAPDLVRDAVGEVVVLGRAQVLEGQHGDALDAARARRPGPCAAASRGDSPAAASRTTTAAAISAFRRHFFSGATTMACTPLVTVVVGLDASESANATSFADWKRLLRVLLQTVPDDVVQRGRDVPSRIRQLRRLFLAGSPRSCRSRSPA